MRATTKAKRKPLLDLELELQGDADDDGAPAPRQKPPQRSGAGVSDGREQVRLGGEPAKKKKEFAWMDSDDDSEAGGKAKAKSSQNGRPPDNSVAKHCRERPSGREDRGSKWPRRSASRSKSANSRSSSEGPPLPASVTEIQTFSQMVRMVGKLKTRVRAMEPTELVQTLAAAARVKFYDAGFLKDLLLPRVVRHLGPARRKSSFSSEELVTILYSLAELNNFDHEVFSRIVRELADFRHKELQSIERQRILAAFKALRYDCAEDPEFYQWLTSVEKAERYEAACVEQRMIVGNSKNGMHAPEGYLRSFMVGTTNNGVEVRRPQGLTS